MIAKFAYAQAVFRANRRTEDTACHRARFVELTISGLRIESGARFIVGEISKALIGRFALIQNAGDGVAGEFVSEPGDCFARTLADGARTLRGVTFQLSKPAAQPERIKLIDRKCSDTALRTSRAADQPFSALTGSIGEGGVDDLDQFLVARRWKAGTH